MELRRKRARVSTAGWTGRCTVDSNPRLDWTDCQVVDLSLLGAGVEIWSDCSMDLTGSRAFVEVWPPTTESLRLRFSGHIKWFKRESAFHARIGIEFDGPVEPKEAIVRLIGQPRSESLT